jgi:ribosomal protein S18 acetylase RimI-like enzyme
MNITLRQAHKKDVFEYSNMARQFRQDYQGSGKLSEMNGSFKQAVLGDIKRGACQFILVDGQVAGYVDLMIVTELKTDKMAHCYILNLFVKPQFRSQGVAKQVRKELLKNPKILGSVVTYERARALVDYYKEIGFTHVRCFPEYDFGGRDENLCLVLSPNHKRDKMTLELTEEHTYWTQNLANKLAELQNIGEIPSMSIVKQ